MTMVRSVSLGVPDRATHVARWVAVIRIAVLLAVPLTAGFEPPPHRDVGNGRSVRKLVIVPSRVISAVNGDWYVHRLSLSGDMPSM